MLKRALILVTALGAAACGANVDIGSPGELGETRRTPQIPAGIAPPPAGCSAPQLVPAGKAWLTGKIRADEHGTLQPHTCEDSGANSRDGRRFSVGDVFLDEMEVTIACFAACVEEGTCDAPPPQHQWMTPDYPIRAGIEHATQFCAWRGGRLATVLELVRASHGELLHIANPALYQTAAACATGPTAGWDEECDVLRDHVYGTLPAGSVPQDVGPFGHHDLFGGGWEATATYHQWGVACDYPPDADEPAAFGEREIRFTGGFAAFTVYPNYVGNLLYVDVADQPMSTAFRCAYDPVYGDDEAG